MKGQFYQALTTLGLVGKERKAIIYVIIVVLLGHSWWLRWQRICLQHRRPESDPWVRKIPWRRNWSCLEKSMDRGAIVIVNTTTVSLLLFAGGFT